MGVWRQGLAPIAVGVAIWYMTLTGGHAYQKPDTGAYPPPL